MEIKGKRTLQAGRLFEALQKTASLNGMAECCCCLKTRRAREFAYVESYEPRDPIMRKAVPADVIAAYNVCMECADTLPENEVFKKCERTLVGRGLLKQNHKPLSAPGRHTKRKPDSEGPRIIANS